MAVDFKAKEGKMSKDIEDRLSKLEQNVDKLLNNSHIRAALATDKFYDDSVEPAAKKLGKVADDFDDPHYALTKYKNKLDKWIYNNYDDTSAKVKEKLKNSSQTIHKWALENYTTIGRKVINFLSDPQKVGFALKDLKDSTEDLFLSEFNKVLKDIAKQPIEKWDEILDGWKEGSKKRQMVMNPKAMDENKRIFENYFKKNRHLIPEQMFELETDSELDEKIALEVESELEKLPDGHPAKNSQGAKSFFDLVKKGLEDPDIVEDAIASIVSDISTKMT